MLWSCHILTVLCYQCKTVKRCPPAKQTPVLPVPQYMTEIHQFLMGLPAEISKQLQAAGEIEELDK